MPSAFNLFKVTQSRVKCKRKACFSFHFRDGLWRVTVGDRHLTELVPEFYKLKRGAEAPPFSTNTYSANGSYVPLDPL